MKIRHKILPQQKKKKKKKINLGKIKSHNKKSNTNKKISRICIGIQNKMKKHQVS